MYILEGTIGAGKSTFLKLLLKAIPEIIIQLEPVDSWQSQESNASLLHQFYTQPQRWAYTFETFTMIKRIHEYRQNSSSGLTVVERSIYSGHYVFARNSYENGFMTDLEWELYKEWFEFLTATCRAPQGFIYLKVDPEVAFERIQKRKRASEDSIPLDYLQQLEHQHERFLSKKDDVVPLIHNVPVLTLDCNQEFEDNSSNFKIHCQKIKEFIGIR